MSLIWPVEVSLLAQKGKKASPPFESRSRDVTSNRSTVASSNCDVLASFCPHIVSYLTVHEVSVISSRTFTFPACCMLADISGFTKLSSELCDRGAAGLDELRHATSSIFGTIVDLVTSHGGDVLYFAGDALICVFQDVYTPYRHVVCAAQRVVACAMSIQQIRTPLVIHSAISAGDINLTILGGVAEQWSYVISGDCVTELAQCLDDAGPRETVITVHVVDAVNRCLSDMGGNRGSGFRLRELPSGNSCVLDAPALAQNELIGGFDDVCIAAVATSFVPSPVLRAAYSGTVSELAELRIITTLFMKLDSYSPTEHKDLTSLQPFYHAMQEIIFMRGGYIRQFIIDDKGCVLIVLWGVPTASFPNNCSRAVRCAASMAAKTTSLNHACSIGITTGTAFCGIVGSSRRQEYVAMGKTVNLAARLMIKACGEILTDETTRDYLGEAIVSMFAPLPPVKLKGFDKPVICYAYSSTAIPEYGEATYRRNSTTTFVTNHEASVTVAKILEAARCLKSGTTCNESLDTEDGTIPEKYFIISGSVGYGKSTLATNIGIMLEAKGYRVLKLALSQQHETHLFVVMRELFLLLVGPQNFDNAHKQEEVVWDLLQRCYPEEDMLELTSSRFPILQCILQLKWSSNISTPINYHDATVCDNSTMMNVLSYLIKKRNVTAIIIDNAHHMCSGTWNQLAYFALNQVPVIIVLTILDQTVVEGDTPASSAYVASGADVKSTLRHPRRSVHSVTRKDTTSRGYSSMASQSFGIGSLYDATTTHVLNLTALNEQSVLQMIESRITQGGVTREIVKKVYKLSHGNPYWVSELAKVIAECGIEAFAKLVSKGIEQNLLATCILSRYTTAQCSVIKMASILGREFHTDILVAIVAPDIKASLSRIIFELVEAGIIRYVENDVYRFQSSLLSDMIYGLIPPSTASSLHYEAAKTIEAHYVNDLSDNVASLAYHYSMSPRDARHHAFAYAASAAEKRSAQLAFSDALNYLQLALEVSSAPEDVRALYAVVNRSIDLIELLRNSSARHKTSNLLNHYIHFMKMKDVLESRSAVVVSRGHENMIMRAVKRLICGGRVQSADLYSS